eukprot:scaffold677713_cov39-Prasinocladus_malaysianus.AAC.1
MSNGARPHQQSQINTLEPTRSTHHANGRPIGNTTPSDNCIGQLYASLSAYDTFPTATCVCVCMCNVQRRVDEKQFNKTAHIIEAK